MTRIRTWSELTRNVSQANHDIALIGNSEITRVSYFAPPTLANDVWHYEGFDVVPGGVLLDALPEPIFVVWSLHRIYGEGLAIIRGADYLNWVTDLNLVEVISKEVSERTSAIRNQQLAHVAVSWQSASPDVEPPAECSSVWALTVGVPEQSITLALGTASESGDAPTYQPDSVAVIFDTTRASRYRPATATSSAAGETIWSRNS